MNSSTAYRVAEGIANGTIPESMLNHPSVSPRDRADIERQVEHRRKVAEDPFFGL